MIKIIYDLDIQSINNTIIKLNNCELTLNENVNHINENSLLDILYSNNKLKILNLNNINDLTSFIKISNIKVIKNKSLKAKDVMKILNITRPTLCKYVKKGLIKIDGCINHQYAYNEESVYNLLSGNH